MRRMVGPAGQQPDVHRCHSPEFMVGRRCDGRWLAVEADGRTGRVFSSQHAAMTFAEAQTHHRRGSIRLVLEPIAFGG